MFYKCNLVLIENLMGFVRLVRGMVILVMENVVFWYECDIFYFSVEWNIGLDVMIIFDFVLYRLIGVIDKLVVYLENM